LTEYFILSMLILRGIRAGQKGLHLRWVLVTILIVACYASLDEYHQSFVPGRTAAVGDVLIDTTGGIAAQIVAALFVLLGKSREKRHEDERKAASAIPTSTL
jgi:VanZ family protein